ncbi:MAG: MOSC domain-containing protein [Dehalococcoidia bacterium]
MKQGHVEAIYIYPEEGKPGSAAERVNAVARRGLEGDRYFLGEGTFYRDDKEGQDLTLVDAEAIEAVRESGIPFDLGDSRRNVVTRGVALNDLVGARFMVGEVECLGVRLCHPCTWLESLTSPGVMKAMLNRGGLRARIVRGGQIAPGDKITVLDEPVADAALSASSSR